MRVLFTGYAPVHFLCFKPLYERLIGMPGLDVGLSGGTRTKSPHTVDGYLYDHEDMYRRLPSMPMGGASIEFVRNGRTLYGAGGEDRMRSRSARLFEGRLVETSR